MASRSWSNRLHAVVIAIASGLLSGCYFAAETQVFTQADFTYVDPIRLEVLKREFGSESSRRIISVQPNADGKTIRMRFLKEGQTSECDVGFVDLVKPAGYYIMTSTTRNCAFFTQTGMVLPYYYVLVGNVHSERIKNQVMRKYVKERTPTFIWPFFLNPPNKEYDYLVEMHGLDIDSVKEDLLFLRSLDPSIKIPQGSDQDIEVIKGKELTKVQLLKFVREAVEFNFFRKHIGSEVS